MLDYSILPFVLGKQKHIRIVSQPPPTPWSWQSIIAEIMLKMTEFYEGITLYDHGGYNEDYMKVVKKKKLEQNNTENPFKEIFQSFLCLLTIPKAFYRLKKKMSMHAS